MEDGGGGGGLSIRRLRVYEHHVFPPRIMTFRPGQVCKPRGFTPRFRRPVERKRTNERAWPILATCSTSCFLPHRLITFTHAIHTIYPFQVLLVTPYCLSVCRKVCLRIPVARSTVVSRERLGFSSCVHVWLGRKVRGVAVGERRMVGCESEGIARAWIDRLGACVSG